MPSLSRGCFDAGPRLRVGLYCSRGRIDTFDTNPKRKRGNRLPPSLALRVSITLARGRYNLGGPRRSTGGQAACGTRRGAPLWDALRRCCSTCGDGPIRNPAGRIGFGRRRRSATRFVPLGGVLQIKQWPVGIDAALLVRKVANFQSKPPFLTKSFQGVRGRYVHVPPPPRRSRSAAVRLTGRPALVAVSFSAPLL